jgi:DnaJ-domain-containing protein 1
LPFILFKQKQKMGRLAEKIDKRRKNYHAFREDVDSYFTARIIVSDMQD